MDGLLGFDPEQLKQLMSAFSSAGAPTPEDRADANKQAMVTLGLLLMQGRKGQELATIGQSGLGAIGQRNQILADIPRNRIESMKAAQGAMSTVDLMRKMQEQEQERQTAMKYAQGVLPGQQIGAVPQQVPSGPPPMGNVVGMSVTSPPGAMPLPNMPPSVQAQSPSKQSFYDYYTGLAQAHQSAGQSDAARRAIEEAMKFQPKLKEQRTLTQNGKRVQVNIYEDGSTKILPDLTPDQEKAHFADVGSGIVPLDPFTGKPVGAALPKSVGPEAQLSANVTMRGQNMTDARAREQVAASGPIVETSQGFARVGKDNTVTPIVAGGAQLQPKPTGAVTQQIATNNVTLQKIDRAMELVDKTPDAFGLKNLAGDTAMQRINPSGVAARAMVADIAGQKIHDRSGAAVTVGEAERLKPYIPNVTDTQQVVKKKLGMFKQEYQAMQAELAGGRLFAQGASTGAGSGSSGGWSITEVK